MNTMYPQVVRDVEAYLKTCDFNFISCEHDYIEDNNSEYVIDLILQKFDGIKNATDGGWYNLMLQCHEQNIFCNVVVVNDTLINIHQKEAYVHSLTSLNGNDLEDELSMNDLLRIIESDLLDDRDFQKECYFIVIDMNDHTIVTRSICDIQSYQSFQDHTDSFYNILQINWEKEKIVENVECITNMHEIKTKILSVIAETLKHMLLSSTAFLEQFYHMTITTK